MSRDPHTETQVLTVLHYALGAAERSVRLFKLREKRQKEDAIPVTPFHSPSTTTSSTLSDANVGNNNHLLYLLFSHNNRKQMSPLSLLCLVTIERVKASLCRLRTAVTLFS